MNYKTIIFCKIFLLLSCITAAQNFWGMPSNNPAYMNSNPVYTNSNPAHTNIQPKQARTKPIGTQQNRIQTRAGITTTTQPPPMGINPFYEFNKKLFYVLGSPFSRSNIIFSSLSLQTLLGFIYTGAEAETADELRTALAIPEMPGEVARLFQALLLHTKQQTSEDLKLEMVNNMYYNDELAVNYDFYARSIPYFEAEIQPINFKAPVQAAAQINKIVADKTEQRIKNLIKPGTLYTDTQAILINAIYLKAKWNLEFSTSDTQKEAFEVSNGRTIPVDMMYLEEEFNTGELPGLNAKAIELPFKNSNISMLIILPNEVDGLANLEITLGSVDLNSLSSFLNRDQVTLRMPKFKFEFDIDMSAPLKSMGASRLFSDNAQLDGFFSNQRVRVAKIQHKAYINVNEGGVEASAASFGKLLPLSLPFKMNYFTIDHPFIFVIRSPHTVYFIGHVVRP